MSITILPKPEANCIVSPKRTSLLCQLKLFFFFLNGKMAQTVWRMPSKQEEPEFDFQLPCEKRKATHGGLALGRLRQVDMCGLMVSHLRLIWKC